VSSTWSFDRPTITALPSPSTTLTGACGLIVASPALTMSFLVSRPVGMSWFPSRSPGGGWATALLAMFLIQSTSSAGLGCALLRGHEPADICSSTRLPPRGVNRHHPNRLFTRVIDARRSQKRRFVTATSGGGAGRRTATGEARSAARPRGRGCSRSSRPGSPRCRQ
jgi:hypothetical protein